MAALPKPAPRVTELVDLRLLSARDLDAMLTEETRTWRGELDWDFQKSADLVRHFLDIRGLSGSALVAGGKVVGYSYFVFEDNKGLIGDLYVCPAFQSPAAESRLLGAVLEGLISTPHVRRIESQLMMIDRQTASALPGGRYLQSFDREFMLAELSVNAALRPRVLPHRVAIERWTEHYQEPAAHLIAEAYREHLDSRINDQYRSVCGARKFLYNIVQYPGCGAFYKPASLVAFSRETGKLLGISLTSLVGTDVGHITQICVSGDARGTGLGYELLRRSLSLLRENGCRRASLTVTSANRDAVRLYRNTGFQSVRKFLAYVWEGF